MVGAVHSPTECLKFIAVMCSLHPTWKNFFQTVVRTMSSWANVLERYFSRGHCHSQVQHARYLETYLTKIWPTLDSHWDTSLPFLFSTDLGVLIIIFLYETPDKTNNFLVWMLYISRHLSSIMTLSAGASVADVRINKIFGIKAPISRPNDIL